MSRMTVKNPLSNSSVCRTAMSRLQTLIAGLFVVSFVWVLIPAGATPPSVAAPLKESVDSEPVTPENVASSDLTDTDYVRIDEDEDGDERAMQTAVVTFVGTPGTRFGGQKVDLFGVVHIGGDDYYRDIDRRLGGYDVVLYELVAPDGTRIRPEDLEERRSILASLQGGMKDMLALEYQLEKIDYLAENFRHADMSPEEFTADLEKRGDSMFKMFARMAGASLAAQASSGGDVGLFVALFSDDRPLRLRRVMARQLMDVDAVTAGMQDEKGGDTLIKSRNAKAMRILAEELEKGKQHAAVFYGAGHLPDMAERLIGEFQMKPVAIQWLDAWDLKGESD